MSHIAEPLQCHLTKCECLLGEIAHQSSTIGEACPGNAVPAGLMCCYHTCRTNYRLNARANPSPKPLRQSYRRNLHRQPLRSTPCLVHIPRLQALRLPRMVRLAATFPRQCQNPRLSRWLITTFPVIHNTQSIIRCRGPPLRMCLT